MDTIANMLITIVNAQAVGKQRVAVPYSQFKESLAHTLREHGRLAAVRVQEGQRAKLILTLTYDDSGGAAINGVKRLSSPGQRRYASSRQIPYPFNGLGTVIISTPQGLMDDKKARQLGVGGELICEIW